MSASIDDFDYSLPQNLIAQQPLAERDRARMLEVADHLADLTVSDLPDRLAPGDLLVINDTRVIPSRLAGRRGDAAVELTLHRADEPDQWRAFARPARRLKPGDRITFAPDFAAIVVQRGAAGEVTIRFDALATGETVLDRLHRHGTTPLPPYIKRPRGAADVDRERYQTLFAAHPGAVAAPTAGLHFTPRLLQALADRGVRTVPLTLHVGAGTFLPVTAERIEDHVMHPEWGSIGAETATAVNAARAAGRRVVAVGTTSLRLLETAADGRGVVQPFAGETRLFITPGFRFRVVDRLLTNFHVPKSTLLMLVAAFAGRDRIRGAYAHAVAAGYRFYSYGDCCLLHRHDQP